MSSLASAVYFLSCCRPTYGSSFCYFVEYTKFINSEFYLNKSLKQGECPIHKPLQDHCLNRGNKCTDYRAWSNDNDQQRNHFLEISSGQKNLCGPGSPDEFSKIKEIPVKDEVQKKKEDKIEKPLEEKQPAPPVAIVAPVKSTQQIKEEPQKKPDEIKVEPDLVKKSSEHIVQKIEEVPVEDDDFRRLDCSLIALEDIFYKFISKNRCLIQNLVQCLNFEKQKQKVLEADYCKLKQDNDALKMKNKYLQMVNSKQIVVFKNELDGAITENKCVYSKKIQELECQIQHYQEELHYYKKNEIKILDAVENEKEEKTQLKCDVRNLKGKEAKLLKNYLEVLKFLEEVKKTLANCNGKNKGYTLQRSSNTMSDCGTSLDLNGVLENALKNGIENLNVRDLSILHDAVQEVNQRLCHQNDVCGVNPMANLTISHLSMVYTSTEHCEEFPSSDSIQNEFQGYESSSKLSMYPSKQKPDNEYYNYCSNNH